MNRAIARARRDTARSRAPTARTRRDAGWRCRARSTASSRRARPRLLRRRRGIEIVQRRIRREERKVGAVDHAARPRADEHASVFDADREHRNRIVGRPAARAPGAAIESRAVPDALERAVVAQRAVGERETRVRSTRCHRADRSAIVEQADLDPSDRFTPSVAPSGRSSTSARYSNSLMLLPTAVTRALPARSTPRRCPASSADCSACHASVAHFTRSGNRDTPPSARSDPSDACSDSGSCPVTSWWNRSNSARPRRASFPSPLSSSATPTPWRSRSPAAKAHVGDTSPSIFTHTVS